MDAQFVHKDQMRTARMQGAGAIVSEHNRLNALELLRKMHNIDLQNAAVREKIDANLKKALEYVESVRDFVNDPSHILGSPPTKHGEIAEQVDINFHNADRVMHNRKADASKEGVGRTAPEDYRVNGVSVQSKYLNDTGKSLYKVLEHLEKYKDIGFGRDGSYYVIPKDQYEQIKKVLSGDTEGLNAKSIRAIKERIREIEEQTGRSFFDVVRAGNVDYAAVQRGKIMETLDDKSDQLNKTADSQKQRADDRSDKKREEARQEAAPSLKKAGKAAAQAALIAGAVQLADGIYWKCNEGKKINAFTLEDWKDIGIDTAKAAAEGGISGGAIYSITNFTSIPAGPAAAGVSLVMSISELAYCKAAGTVSDEEFKERCQRAVLNAAVSAVGASIGQTLIPVPLLGAWLGSFIASKGLEQLCDEGFHNALALSAYEVQKMTQRLGYGTARIAYSSAYTDQALSRARDLHEETRTILDDFDRKKR